MMKTLFLQAPSFEGFDGGAGARYQMRREVKSFWYPTWLAQPAAWSVPAAFAATVMVSIMTRKRVPSSVNRVMSRLHVPERPVATER